MSVEVAECRRSLEKNDTWSSTATNCAKVCVSIDMFTLNRNLTHSGGVANIIFGYNETYN